MGTQTRGRQNDQIAGPGQHRAEIRGLTNREILGYEAGDAKCRRTLPLQSFVVALTGVDFAGELLQGRMQAGCGGPLVLGQMTIDRGERKAVSLAKGGAADDFYGQEEILDHAAHDDELLKI